MATNQRRDEVADLLVEHQRYIRGAAYALARHSPVDFHDLAQATYELVLKNRHQWNRVDFKKWVYTILYRQFLLEKDNELKQRGIDLDDDAKARIPDPAPVGAETAIEMLEFEQLTKRLSTDHCEILRLDIKGISYREMADLLDIPIGTVMSRLKRAKRRYNALRLEDQSRDEAQA